MEVQKQYRYLLIILLTALLIPYLYVSQYANPVADDLIYAASGKKYELLDLLIRDYVGWNGRYLSNIFVFTNPMVFNSLAGYKLAPVILIVLTVLSNLFFITSIIGDQLDIYMKTILTLLLSLLFFYQMPIVSEGIYWYTGAITYQLANVLMVLYLGCLIRYAHGKIILKSRIIHLILLIVLLIACIGFNETHMIAFFSFAFLSLWIVWKNKLKHQSLFIFLLIITLIFSALLFFSPGNDARAGLATTNHQFIHSLLFSFAQTLRFFLEWTSSVPLLILSFFYYFFNERLSEKSELFSNSFYLTPVYSCALLFFVIFIGVFPPYWATGILGQYRTLNVSYYLFLLMWFINLTVFFNLYKNEWKTIKPLPLKFSGLLMIIVIVSFSFTKNGYNIALDIFYGKAQQYDKQMKERYELMRYPTDTIYFHPLIDPPKTLFVNDIEVDPANWLNQAYILYFDCENKSLVKK